MKNYNKLLQLSEKFEQEILKEATHKDDWTDLSDLKISLNQRLEHLMGAINLKSKGDTNDADIKHHLDKSAILIRTLIQKLEKIKSDLSL